MVRKSSFTLTELLIAIVIVGILAALGLPNYNLIQEKALDREAKATLALMRAAERIYKMEIGTYFPGSGSESSLSLINSELKLSLPTGSPKWSYRLDNTSGTGVTEATRSGRTWGLDAASSSEVPVCTGSCL